MLTSIVLLLLSVSACSYATQATSGKSYIEKYSGALDSVATLSQSMTFAEQLQQAAAVEPTLKFPARIGLARVSRGGLIDIPAEELEQWTQLHTDLGSRFGRFVPLNGLAQSMTQAAINADRANEHRTTNGINQIRLLAARQHLDAVLLYEVFSESETDHNLLAFTDFTLIGMAVFPSRTIRAKGFARAALIDVVQGYPYATTQAGTKERSVVAVPRYERDVRPKLTSKVEFEAAEKLIEDTGTMFKELRADLAESRLLRRAGKEPRR